MRASSFVGGVVRESLLREVGCGERWIPACAGMTEGVAGMTEGVAGITEGVAGMTEGVVGMASRGWE